MPQTKLIFRNYAALALLTVLTVAVIAVEFLPTGASAQIQIYQSLRPSTNHQPKYHIFRAACDLAGSNRCTQECFALHCPSNHCSDAEYTAWRACMEAKCSQYLSSC